MSTVIRRCVASTPQRGAMETWETICALLAPDLKSAARQELDRVGGVAAASISSEAVKDDAIVVHGSGPRVRIYCVFDEAAVNGEGVEEDSFSKSPTEGDWQLSLPVPKEDLEWSQRKLKACSTRVTARAVGEDVPEKASAAATQGGGATVNLEEFMKP